jgi:hypothetical protein
LSCSERVRDSNIALNGIITALDLYLVDLVTFGDNFWIKVAWRKATLKSKILLSFEGRCG